MIVQADIPAAQQARAVYEVADVANPYGEVMVGGELRRHKAVRRVAHFETLFRARVFDVSVFRVLAWYDHQLARAAGGMYKCGLDVSGGGSGAGHGVTTAEAAMQARSCVAWARNTIPADLLPAFDGVMDGETFEQVGARVYGHLCLDRSKRRASSAFRLAANHLLLGVGHLLGVGG